MGILFNFLMMREIMKAQGLNQVGDENSGVWSNNKSTVQVYDGNNKCFRHFVDLCKGANDAILPRVLGDVPFKSKELPNARVVNWEKLEPCDPEPFNDYDNWNRFSGYMTNLHVNKQKPSNQEFEWCKEFMGRHKPYTDIFNALPPLFLKYSPTCTMNFGPGSWMRRRSQLVLVDPFHAK